MKKHRPKIYDCFMYHNEEMLLDIRLNYLNNFVDRFIIVESSRTHSGKKKRLNFNINKYLKFKKKIKYIVVDDLPINAKAFYKHKKLWHKNHVRDQYQRNQIMRGLDDAKPDDIIMISDVDEIPKLDNFDFKIVNRCFVFFQKLYRLKFNLESIKDYPWQGTKAVKFKYLKSPQEIRDTVVKRVKFWQIYRYFNNPKFIADGGWHFTTIIPLNKIYQKFKNGAHGEINLQKFKNLKLLKKNLEKKLDIFNNQKLKLVKLDNSFPNYILKNKMKYKNFIV